jgi:hypothetical protein
MLGLVPYSQFNRSGVSENQSLPSHRSLSKEKFVAENAPNHWEKQHDLKRGLILRNVLDRSLNTDTIDFKTAKNIGKMAPVLKKQEFAASKEQKSMEKILFPNKENDIQKLKQMEKQIDDNLNKFLPAYIHKLSFLIKNMESEIRQIMNHATKIHDECSKEQKTEASRCCYQMMRELGNIYLNSVRKCSLSCRNDDFEKKLAEKIPMWSDKYFSNVIKDAKELVEKIDQRKKDFKPKVA